MKKILFLFAITTFSVLLTDCKIGEDGSQVVRDLYGFQEFFTLTNVKQEYVVGDLIWMEYSRPNKVMNDLTTGIEVVVAIFSVLSPQ